MFRKVAVETVCIGRTYYLFEGPSTEQYVSERSKNEGFRFLFWIITEVLISNAQNEACFDGQYSMLRLIQKSCAEVLAYQICMELTWDGPCAKSTGENFSACNELLRSTRINFLWENLCSNLLGC